MSVETITAMADRVFEGWPVGAGGKGECECCHEVVREGEQVGIYAYQLPGEPWDVSSLYCERCRPEDIVHPTHAAGEVVAHARLAVTHESTTQTARLTLSDVTTREFSPTDDGSEA